MTVSALVFDFDGVLADSEPLHFRAYQEIFASLGAEMSREEYYGRYLGFDDEGVFREFFAERGSAMSREQIEVLIGEKSRLVETMIADTDVLYPGAAICIERMAAAFPLGIASGSLKHEIELILQRARLARHFRFIVAAGETASKPAPDPYLLAAARHKLPPAACVAIEDSQWGIASAQAAGLKCIGITHTYPRAMLTDADAIIDTLDELTPGLVRLLGG
jgi:beta-phosphoglucomutase